MYDGGKKKIIENEQQSSVEYLSIYIYVKRTFINLLLKNKLP